MVMDLLLLCHKVDPLVWHDIIWDPMLVDQKLWKPLESGLAEALKTGKANLYLECVFIFVKMNYWPFQGLRGPLWSTSNQVAYWSPWLTILHLELRAGLCCQQARHLTATIARSTVVRAHGIRFMHSLHPCPHGYSIHVPIEAALRYNDRSWMISNARVTMSTQLQCLFHCGRLPGINTQYEAFHISHH